MNFPVKFEKNAYIMEIYKKMFMGAQFIVDTIFMIVMVEKIF